MSSCTWHRVEVGFQEEERWWMVQVGKGLEWGYSGRFYPRRHGKEWRFFFLFKIISSWSHEQILGGKVWDWLVWQQHLTKLRLRWYLNYMRGCRRFQKRIARTLSFKTATSCTKLKCSRVGSNVWGGMK